MNIIDYVLIILVILGALIGFKKGMISSAVSLVGIVFVIVGAIYLKNPIGMLFYRNLPFMNFGGVFKGLSSLNILIYEGIAFVLCLIILTIILKVILKLSGIIDKLINLTIIFALPSRLIGMVLGALQYFLIAFTFIFVISLFPKTNPYVMESKYGGKILEGTPLVSMMTKNIYESISKVYDIGISYTDRELGDYDSLKSLLDHNIINIDTVRLLNEKGKIKIEKVDELIQEYGGNND